MNDPATENSAPESEQNVLRRAPRKFLLEDPAEGPRRARRRFLATTFAIATITIVVGTMGARHLARAWAVRRSYVTIMTGDLGRLANAQQAFHDEHDRYAARGELGARFIPSQGVTVRIRSADVDSWRATATHSRASTVCVLAVDPSRTQTTEPQPTCR